MKEPAAPAREGNPLLAGSAFTSTSDATQQLPVVRHLTCTTRFLVSAGTKPPTRIARLWSEWTDLGKAMPFSDPTRRLPCAHCM